MDLRQTRDEGACCRSWRPRLQRRTGRVRTSRPLPASPFQSIGCSNRITARRWCISAADNRRSRNCNRSRNGWTDETQSRLLGEWAYSQALPPFADRRAARTERKVVRVQVLRDGWEDGDDSGRRGPLQRPPSQRLYARVGAIRHPIPMPQGRRGACTRTACPRCSRLPSALRGNLTLSAWISTTSRR